MNVGQFCGHKKRQVIIMIRFGEKIVKSRIAIIVLSVILLIPSVIGYFKTRVNYDILYYLPKDIETMVGQDILVVQFGTGAFSFLIIDGMSEKDAAKVKEKVEGVEHVTDDIWYDSVADLSIPMNMLPDELYNTFNNGDATMMAVIFDETTSADGTMEAIEKIRNILKSIYQILLKN